MKRKVLILHNAVLNGTPDEVDVLVQRDLVRTALQNMQLEVSCLALGEDIRRDMTRIETERPDLVFNLVEAIWGKGELIYLAPAILNALKIPFTGVPLEAMFITTNKVLAKKIMRENGLPTADFFSVSALEDLDPRKTYIAKPIWEEASVGISEDRIFSLSEIEKTEKVMRLPDNHYFTEEFIEGREFNVSLLADERGVEVLPAAEMIFSDYFSNRPKIVGYKAKWDAESEEYKQTNRAFGTLEQEPALREQILGICRQTWQVFRLKGYARVDLRVDGNNKAYILEINGNPCIAPDSGFVAAAQQAGYSIETMISRIMKDVN